MRTTSLGWRPDTSSSLLTIDQTTIGRSRHRSRCSGGKRCLPPAPGEAHVEERVAEVERYVEGEAVEVHLYFRPGRPTRNRPESPGSTEVEAHEVVEGK